MDETPGIERYVLVPRGSEEGGVRRYSLARVGVQRRSALGQDRHERLEQVAGFNPDEADPPRAAGPDPGPAAP